MHTAAWVIVSIPRIADSEIVGGPLVLRMRRDTARRPGEVLDLLRDDEEGLKQGPARVLYAAMRGELSPQENRNDHSVQLAWLFNVGALVDRRAERGSRNSLTDDTDYCPDFEA